jgi:hypothetical protein
MMIVTDLEPFLGLVGSPHGMDVASDAAGLMPARARWR